MTDSAPCPLCGDPLPQFGGDADQDILRAHYEVEHAGETDAKPDLTYRHALLAIGVLVLIVAALVATGVLR